MRQLASVFLLIVLSGCASRAGESGEVGAVATTDAIAPAPTPEAVPPAEPIVAAAADPAPAPVIETPAAPVPEAPRVIGMSRENREIRARTYGAGPMRVYIIGSIHGDEDEGRSALAHLHEHLAAASLGATVRLVDDMNPDGSERGTRTCSSGVDLNRNWPAANFKAARQHGPSPLSEPEAEAVHHDIVAFDPHLLIVLHSARRGPFVNFDGPPAAETLAERFASAAKGSGDTRWRTVADMGYPTPGSMGSYFGKDRQVPILTVEFKRGDTTTKIPGALVAGVEAVASGHSVALEPLSTRPGRRLVQETTPDGPDSPVRADLGR